MSLDDVFDHPFFKKVRKQDKEMDAASSIQFDWENQTLDKIRLREHFVEEIMFFKQVRAQA